MPEFLRRARPAAAAVFMSLALVACDGDGEEGGDEFNEETAAEMAGVADEVSQAAVSSEQVQANVGNAFGAMISGGGGGPVSPLLPFEVVGQMRAHRSFRDMASVRMPAAMRAPGAPNGILLPDWMEGITFVWDVTDSMYVPSDVPGAPANGARFIYYSVNPLTGYPTLPLNEVGYMDIVDGSTSEVARLEVFARDEDNDRTVADYFLQGSIDSLATGSTLTLQSEGFYANASRRLDFDMQIVAGGNETRDELHTTVELASEDGSITLEHDEVQTDSDYSSEGTFVIEGEGNEAEFVFDVTGTELGDEIDGALLWNGVEVVLIEGDAENPEFTDPDGGNLTANQVEALATMWHAFSATYAFAILTLVPFFFLMLFSGF